MEEKEEETLVSFRTGRTSPANKNKDFYFHTVNGHFVDTWMKVSRYRGDAKDLARWVHKIF